MFSAVSFLTILYNYIFFRTKPNLNICLGALIGVSGLAFFFWDEIAKTALRENTLKGLGLALIGTCIFSLGGCFSRRNHEQGLEIIPSMTVAMGYGTFVMLVYCLFQSSPFVFPQDTLYWASLFYLVIPGSIVAFLCYLKLIKNIGPELAGYSTVLFPVVALVVSSVLESYDWSVADLLGLSLVISGNVLVLRRRSLKSLFLRLSEESKPS